MSETMTVKIIRDDELLIVITEDREKDIAPEVKTVQQLIRELRMATYILDDLLEGEDMDKWSDSDIYEALWTVRTMTVALETDPAKLLTGARQETT